MNDVILTENIYVKRSNAKLGGGHTSRECILESLWFPYRVINGFVELFPVMDDLKRILRIKESISVEVFKNEYVVKENSRDIYLRLKEMIR